MRALSVVLIATGIAIWVLSLSIGASYFAKNRPAHPEPDKGLVVEFNQHGNIHYISRRDNLVYQLAGACGILVGGIGGALFARHRSGYRA
jgi:hypothetical protein